MSKDNANAKQEDSCILFDCYSFSSCPDFSSAVVATDSKLLHLRHTITPRLSRSHQLLYLKAFSVSSMSATLPNGVGRSAANCGESMSSWPKQGTELHLVGWTDYRKVALLVNKGAANRSIISVFCSFPLPSTASSCPSCPAPDTRISHHRTSVCVCGCAGFSFSLICICNRRIVIRNATR